MAGAALRTWGQAAAQLHLKECRTYRIQYVYGVNTWRSHPSATRSPQQHGVLLPCWTSGHLSALTLCCRRIANRDALTRTQRPTRVHVCNPSLSSLLLRPSVLIPNTRPPSLTHSKFPMSASPTLLSFSSWLPSSSSYSPHHPAPTPTRPDAQHCAAAHKADKASNPGSASLQLRCKHHQHCALYALTLPLQRIQLILRPASQCGHQSLPGIVRDHRAPMRQPQQR